LTVSRDLPVSLHVDNSDLSGAVRWASFRLSGEGPASRRTRENRPPASTLIRRLPQPWRRNRNPKHGGVVKTFGSSVSTATMNRKTWSIYASAPRL